jgi:hypothetical protein
MKKADVRMFVETLRNEEPGYLKDVMTDAIHDFCKKQYTYLEANIKPEIEQYKNVLAAKRAIAKSSSVSSQVKAFKTSFKKYANLMPLDVIFAESNYEQADAFKESVDKLADFLEKYHDIDTTDIKNMSDYQKLELGCLLIESQIGILEIFENTMNNYQKRCINFFSSKAA